MKALLLSLILLAGCGYRVSSGTSELVPTTLKTVAIPAFTNITTRYRLTDRLPEAVAREFITRTRYRVVPDEASADMVLRGAVLNYSTFPAILDNETSRAAGVEVLVTMQVSLVERATGKVLFTRPSFEIRERYQISTDPARYYEESDDALTRASRQVASRVVTAILESF